MSYVKPIQRFLPMGQLCDYGCGQPAKYFFKRPKKWCCSESVQTCPVKGTELKEQRNKKKSIRMECKQKFKILNLEYLRVYYPNVYEIDYLKEGAIRFNKNLNCIECRCTYYECPNIWFEPTYKQLGLRNWALTLRKDGVTTNGGDGYRFYCIDGDCRKLCTAYGKTGTKILKDAITDQQAAESEEFEWYGSNALPEDRNMWRKMCLETDKYTCQICGDLATNVHHILPVKTHPESELDPPNGISLCKECHYKYIHNHRTECGLSTLSKKKCYIKINGKLTEEVRKIIIPQLPPGVLSF